jgi:hypothetical protein
MSGFDELVAHSRVVCVAKILQRRIPSLAESAEAVSATAEEIVRALRLPAVPAAAPRAPPAGAARILSYDAMARARTTLEDWTSFYLPLHGLADRDFFRWLPLLVFCEAMIYQADEDNELRAASYASTSSSRSGESPAEASQAATFSCLVSILRSRDLLSDRVQAELDNGLRYWAEERRLCAAMAGGGGGGEGAGNGSAPRLGIDEARSTRASDPFSRPAAHTHAAAHMAGTRGERAQELRLSPAPRAPLRAQRARGLGRPSALPARRRGAASLWHSRRTPIEQPSHSFAQVLTDVGDDLFDYEKDVARNSFNVLRGAVHGGHFHLARRAL